MLAGVHRAPPELWPRLEGEEVRGPTSLAVPVDGTGTASVAPVKAPPVPGVQKPPRLVGKRFRDRLVAAPKKMNENTGFEALHVHGEAK
jgi:sensor domain CHASE-containing protein